MNRRDFLKWFASATVSTGAVLYGAGKFFHTEEPKKIPPQTKTAIPIIQERGYHIAILTDLHIQDARRSISAAHWNEKAVAAIDDMISLDPDIFFVVGDVVNHGYPIEYTFAKQIINRIHTKKIPVFLTMGNHEFYNVRSTSASAIKLFLQTFHQTTPYQSIVSGGIHHVMLSPEYLAGAGRSHDWARLSSQQLEWFDHVLTQHQDKLTFVYLHQPLNDTVEQSQYVDWIARTAQTDQLLAISKNHPQIKCWFSGHTHAPLQHPNQIVYRHGIWFIGGASTFYTNDIRPKNGRKTGPFLGKKYLGNINTEANQNRFVSVYHDRIVIRARDHNLRQWMTELEHVVPISKRNTTPSNS
jgi:3',5'-cyclic-AMP phosphodiesterase